MAVTSSVNAAPAASALPIELALFSFSWKPVANDWAAAKASIDPATAAATRLRRKLRWFMDSPLVVSRFVIVSGRRLRPFVQGFPRQSGLLIAGKLCHFSRPRSLRFVKPGAKDADDLLHPPQHR